MRRKEKEITNRAVIDAIIRQARVCRLALSEDNQPYIVPLCFGYENDALYFHSAPEGRKLDILKKNNKVCFEFDNVGEILTAEKACCWSMQYRSVIGFGQAQFIDDTLLYCEEFNVSLLLHLIRDGVGQALVACGGRAG